MWLSLACLLSLLRHLLLRCLMHNWWRHVSVMNVNPFLWSHCTKLMKPFETHLCLRICLMRLLAYLKGFQRSFDIRLLGSLLRVWCQWHHTISGAEPPFKPMYRFSRPERLAVQEDLTALLHKHKLRIRKEYLVHWKLFGPEHNTWEPEVFLTNCSDSASEYWMQRSGKPPCPTHHTSGKAVRKQLKRKYA